MAATIRIFGIRHHGPGSARSLLRALTDYAPDVLLIEGPPDADSIIPKKTDAGFEPPVAMLVYAEDDPHKAVYYPFAAFSPEWVAMNYAAGANIPARFMDLPQTHRLALSPEQFAPATPPESDPNQPQPAQAAPPNPADPTSPPDPAAAPEPPPVHLDPLGALARAAGYEDGERWWEQVVEQRLNSEGVFEAVLEAMSALREDMPEKLDPFEAYIENLREAYMRRVIRAAQKDGFQKIAVVCGAWHSPVLVPERMPPASSDDALLKGLKKIKVAYTWLPWTHGRLTTASGYGAGITSPGWYQHLWEMNGSADMSYRWLTNVAHLLREQDLDASPAQIIDAIRLAETLASLRGNSLPGLYEFNEAILSTLCFGNEAPMQVIHKKMIVGETIGDVPDDTPMVPLQRDLQAQQKRLRMRPEAGDTTLKLDLRESAHLEKSHLLHRLSLLGVKWGQKERAGGKGTYHEVWKLQWTPELAIQIIEQSIWGNTVEAAAGAYARSVADEADDLPKLTAIVNEVLQADIPAAVDHVVRQLQNRAAVSSDVLQLMGSLPALVDVLTYGNVRKTDASMVRVVVDGIIARVLIGLPGAAQSLADDAAEELYKLILSVNGALRTLDDHAHLGAWHTVLRRMMDQGTIHGLIRGRACRICFDAGTIPTEEVVTQMRLAVSTAEDPSHVAAWLQGFLQESGTILLVNPTLLNTIDSWVMSLAGEQYPALLPLIRRTFSTFNPHERKQIGQILRGEVTGRRKGSRPGSTDADGSESGFDATRADAFLPTFAKLIGVQYDG
jgi:hypothetical protein